MSEPAMDQDVRDASPEQSKKPHPARKWLARVFLDTDHPASAADASYRMRILSVLAISFVVLGHMNFSVTMDLTMTEPLTLQGWFPYYSFHLPLFLFVSGYFFQDLPRDGRPLRGLIRFIGKKAVKLLIPYYIFSGLSLWFGTLIHSQGFTFGESFSWTAWLAGPWTVPYFVSFATPVWYLPALFVTEIMYLFLRGIFRILFKRSLLREILLLLVTLGAGIAAVYYNKKAAPSGTAVVYLRSVIMLFFIQVGALYRRHLEKHDTLKSPWYFLIVLMAQLLLIYLSRNGKLSPGLYTLKDFGETGWVYFACGLTGLMLWLRVSTILGSLPRKSKLLIFIGKNTKYIMALHVFSWFLFNALLNHLYKIDRKMLLVSGFLTRWFKSFMYYCHTTNPRMILLYYVVGMALPLVAAGLMQGLFCGLRRVFRRKRPGDTLEISRPA